MSYTEPPKDENENDPNELGEVQKTRRGRLKHKVNPFLESTSVATLTRKRRTIANTAGDRLLVVAEATGEILQPAGFWHTQEVDQTQFVKLYVNGVRAFRELTNPGARVFEIMYREMQKNIGRDKILLSFQTIAQEETPINERSFYRGMRELLEKNFIAETLVQNLYYVNPDYLWNGDRLAFVKEYRLKSAAPPGGGAELSNESKT